ncbi:hypothetical protein [Mycobacterium sp.]|uniref:hypothetical protein n=1 Tax=Mycobacterium sp. TaxID=1785 RepID=UPI003BA97915
MTEPNSEAESSNTQQISVAELLARNEAAGAPASTRRRRRRRGDSDAVTVAELTGEIPIVRDDEQHDTELRPPKEFGPADGRSQVADPEPPPSPPERVAGRPPEVSAKAAYLLEPQPRWPKSPHQARRRTGPERSEYPRPPRFTEQSGTELDESPSGAEHMSPDPVEHYDDVSVDADAEAGAPGAAKKDSAHPRSRLQPTKPTSVRTLFGGQSIADEVARRRGAELGEDDVEIDSDLAGDEQDFGLTPDKLAALWRGSAVVLQSMLAVVFGAGLYVAFDQLWRWNSIVALVLSVLVILGLVVAVRVVRKTEDIGSTLIAVAVGALVTLGPLALLQSS